MYIRVSRLVPLIGVFLTPFFTPSPARADDSVVTSLIGNARSDTITVYWGAMECTGVVDGRGKVCSSARIGPGQTASYTWLGGQTSKSVTASCQSVGASAMAENWYDDTCTRQDSRPAATSRYLIINKVNGLCLDPHGFDATSGTGVGLYRCDGGLDQVFRLASGAYGSFKNDKSGVCLDVAGYDGASNANVGLYTCETQDDQKWGFYGQSTWSDIKNKKQSLCLEAEGDAKSGARVRLFACDSSDRQKWNLAQVP